MWERACRHTGLRQYSPLLSPSGAQHAAAAALSRRPDGDGWAASRRRTRRNSSPASRLVDLRRAATLTCAALAAASAKFPGRAAYLPRIVGWWLMPHMGVRVSTTASTPTRTRVAACRRTIVSLASLARAFPDHK